MSRKQDSTNSEIPAKNDLHHERNALVVLGCLAEKLGEFDFFLEKKENHFCSLRFSSWSIERSNDEYFGTGIYH